MTPSPQRPRPARFTGRLWQHIRRQLGVHQTLQLLRQIRENQEMQMATEAEQFNALSAKLDDLIADVRSALGTLTAERDQLGPDGQAALDTLNAKVDALDTEVGDADGSDTPAEPPAPETADQP